MDWIYITLGVWLGGATVIAFIIYAIDAIIPGNFMNFSTRIKVLGFALAWPLYFLFSLVRVWAKSGR